MLITLIAACRPWRSSSNVCGVGRFLFPWCDFTFPLIVTLFFARGYVWTGERQFLFHYFQWINSKRLLLSAWTVIYNTFSSGRPCRTPPRWLHCAPPTLEKKYIGVGRNVTVHRHSILACQSSSWVCVWLFYSVCIDRPVHWSVQCTTGVLPHLSPRG